MTSGRAPWFGLAMVVVICLVCSGTLMWFYDAAKHIKASVVRVNSNEAKLKEASQTAQRFLPEFAQRIRHPEPGDRFAVKGRFATSVGPEYLWLKDVKLVRGGFRGALDQAPIALRAKKGDALSVKPGDVYDLMIRRADGSITGGFTEIALQSK